MTNKEPPLALRLADELEMDAADVDDEITHNPMLFGCSADHATKRMKEAAAELRRLHAMNAELMGALDSFCEFMNSAGSWPDSTSDLATLREIFLNVEAVLEKAKEQT